MEIEIVKEKCEAYAAKAGLQLDVPVRVNNRLTVTLGRVKYYINNKPRLIEFSGELLRQGSEEEIDAVIGHEMAHYCVTTITGERHGHDKVFKDMCAQLGVDNNKSRMHVDYLRKAQYNYYVVCPNCGVLSGYRRAGKVVNNIQDYHCAKCGSKELYVES